MNNPETVSESTMKFRRIGGSSQLVIESADDDVIPGMDLDVILGIVHPSAAGLDRNDPCAGERFHGQFSQSVADHVRLV